jgi:hypothetical protein
MAQLPGRRSARNVTLVGPSREFEDIYDRMGQLMSMAFGDMAFTAALAVPPRPGWFRRFSLMSANYAAAAGRLNYVPGRPV